jgi:hypothetical protein
MGGSLPAPACSRQMSYCGCSLCGCRRVGVASAGSTLDAVVRDTFPGRAAAAASDGEDGRRGLASSLRPHPRSDGQCRDRPDGPDGQGVTQRLSLFACLGVVLREVTLRVCGGLF